MIQIDIEMPKTCLECPLHDGEYGWCNLNYDITMDCEERPKECPLHEVTDSDTISRPRWIPVTERMPEIAEPVLFWDADEECICYGYYADPQWRELYVNNFFDNVTAWMPLPEPYHRP